MFLRFERMLDDVEPVDDGLTFRRRNEVQKQIDGRRLTRPVRAKQTEDLPAIDRQVQAISAVCLS
jgi:hypothetical protein